VVISKALILAILIVANAIRPLLAEEKSEISTRVQQLIDQLKPVDESLKPLVIDYHKQSNDSNLEPKVAALIDTRKRLADQLEEATDHDLEELRSQIKDTERKMEGMYKRLAKLESSRSQSAIDSANEMYDAQREKLQTMKSTVESYEALMPAWRHFEQPQGIGLPNGAVVELPVFSEGTAQGYYMHFRGENYEAMMDKKGILYIRIRKPSLGEYFEHQITFAYPEAKYKVTGKSAKRKRKVKALVPPSTEPLSQPGQLLMKGFLKHYVQFSALYTFGPNSITFSGAYRDPVDVGYATEFRFITSLPELKDVPNSESEDPYADCKLKLKEVQKGRPVREIYDYETSVTLNDVVKSASIRGPWGPLKVDIKPSKTREQFDAYTGKKKPLREGYRFRFMPENQDLVRHKGSITVTVISPRD
jgi:hypothetical protein